MSPRDFQVEDRAEIIPALRRFVRYVLRDKVEIVGEARIDKTIHGRRVIYEPRPQVFPGSFRIALSGLRLSIGDGLVSGVVPTLEGRRIDGIDADGVADPRGRPDLLTVPPATGSRSYVVLWARHDADGEIAVPDSPGSLSSASIEVLDELPEGMREADRVARLVGVLEWQGKTIRSVRQVVWYDQEVFSSGGKARMRAAA